MPNVVFSQPNAAGVALLAAHLRLWSANGEAPDLYVVCHRDWTLTDQFWQRTVPWLLGESTEGPSVYRARQTDGLWTLEEATLPPDPSLTLLRIPRHADAPAESGVRLMALADRYGPLRVVEIVDRSFKNISPLRGVRTCSLSHPPLFTMGAISETEIALANVAAAALYDNHPDAFGSVDSALALTRAVRGDVRQVVTDLLNRGASAYTDGEPFRYTPKAWLREGDALFFEVTLSPAEQARLGGETHSFLEHLAQSVLAREEADWGIAYTCMAHTSPPQYVTIVAARYDQHAMRQTLKARLRQHPASRDWPLSRSRSHYTRHSGSPAGMRQMLTAILPAFFPALDKAMRSRRLPPDERNLVSSALAALDPQSPRVLEQRGQRVSLTDGTAWSIHGPLDATHPAVVAAACLLSPTPKEERIRTFHAERNRLGLTTPWHTLKGAPLDPRAREQWTQANNALISNFCRRFLELWKNVRMPFPSDQLVYPRLDDDMADLETMQREAERIAQGAAPNAAFLDAVGRLFESNDGLHKGPGSESFFSLTTLLNGFFEEHRDRRWALGGYWDSRALRGAECVMWPPEVLHHLLEATRDDLAKHAGPSGFMRIRVTHNRGWTELRLLTSGPGAPSQRLRQALELRTGLRTAAQVVFSYNGRAGWRCTDGWHQYDATSRRLVHDPHNRLEPVSVCLVDLPDLEPLVRDNPHLTLVGPDEHPDVMLVSTPDAIDPQDGWQAPRIVVSDTETRQPGSTTRMTRSETRKFLEGLFGFEACYRFPSLAARDHAKASASRRPDRPLRCLVVNDERAQLERWKDDLRGHEVIAASEARTAFGRYRKDGGYIDLVITDNFMPTPDEGITLARRLREDGYAGPIVIATRAPKAVDPREAERLCITVVGNDLFFRNEVLEEWRQHVPSPDRMRALTRQRPGR